MGGTHPRRRPNLPSLLFLTSTLPPPPPTLPTLASAYALSAGAARVSSPPPRSPAAPVSAAQRPRDSVRVLATTRREGRRSKGVDRGASAIAMRWGGRGDPGSMRPRRGWARRSDACAGARERPATAGTRPRCVFWRCCPHTHLPAAPRSPPRGGRRSRPPRHRFRRRTAPRSPAPPARASPPLRMGPCMSAPAAGGGQG